MEQQAFNLVPAQDLPVGQQILEVGQNLTAVNQRLVALTQRLTEWTSIVENSLRDTEGAKIDFGTWASGIENRLGDLGDRIHQEVTERQGCQQGHENDVGKLWEKLDNMKEDMLNQMTDGDMKNSNAIAGLRHDISTKLDTRINAIDTKLTATMTSSGVAMKKHLAEAMEASKAGLVMELEGIKGKIIDVRGRLELMETVKTEMSSMAGHKASQIAARVTEVEERITNGQTQMMKAIDEKMQELEDGMLKTMDQKVQKLEEKMVEKISQECTPKPGFFGFPSQSHSFQSPAAQPASSPIVPPTTPPAPRVNHVRWTKQLSRLSYGEVKTFVTLFKAYLQAANLSEAEAKLTLLQSMEGEALQLLAGLSTQMDTHELLEQLMKRVRPSDTVLEGKLLKIKQKPSEAVQDYFNRFQLIASDLSGYSDERKRDVFMNNLNATWKMTARSLWLPNKTISLTDLAQGLMDLEGSDYADKMEIDHAEVKPAISIEGLTDTFGIDQIRSMERSNFRGMQDAYSLMMSWRDMCRADRGFRAECVRWLNSKPTGPPRRPNFNGRDKRRDFRNGRRIFNVQGESSTRDAFEEPHQDDVFDQEDGVEEGDMVATVHPIRAKPHRMPSSNGSVKVLHRSKTQRFSWGRPSKTHGLPRIARRANEHNVRSPTEAVNTMKFAHKPLMYANVRLNGKGFQALVDTGASTSVLPKRTALKLGVALNTSKTVDLLAFDGSVTKSSGAAVLTVTIGDTAFEHEFCVVPSESKIIFGNDIWTSQKVLIDPAKNQLRLATNKVVLCQAILPKEQEEQQMPKKPPVKLALTATEKWDVEPVIREDVLLIPAGKSFVIPARSSRTHVMPMKSSKTVPVLDSGRLPPGVITATTMLAKHQKLRITTINTTSKSVMIGSRSAVGCIQVGKESVEMIDVGGGQKLVRRV